MYIEESPERVSRWNFVKRANVRIHDDRVEAHIHAILVICGLDPLSISRLPKLLEFLVTIAYDFWVCRYALGVIFYTCRSLKGLLKGSLIIFSTAIRYSILV